MVINGRDKERLAATADELRKATGAKITAVAADVASPEGQKALFAACPEPDILVNNNAGPPFRDFRELDRQKMLDGVIANMVVAVELIQKAIDPMIAKKFGRIVNITSGSVKMPMFGLDLSSGARAGLTAFLAGVARSVAASNVTINFMLPGIFDTDRFRSNVESTAKKRSTSYDDALAANIDSVPARRLGTPDEFGATCAFLCSAQAGYITGQNLLIDGGRIPRRVLKEFRKHRSKEKFMKLVRYGAPGREKPGMIDSKAASATCRKSFPISRARRCRRRA